MLGLLAPTLIAFVAAWASGGALRDIFSTRVRGWPLILAAFAVELLLYNPPLDAQPWALVVGPLIWVVTRLVLLYVAVLNWRTPGVLRWAWLLMALGVGLNTVVVVLNGGHMPQSVEAAASIRGARAYEFDTTRLHNIVPLGPDTKLAWLSDVIPEPAWLPRANVLSIGDVLLALGMAAWVFLASRPGVSWSETPLHGDARPPGRRPI